MKLFSNKTFGLCLRNFLLRRRSRHLTNVLNHEINLSSNVQLPNKIKMKKLAWLRSQQRRHVRMDSLSGVRHIVTTRALADHQPRCQISKSFSWDDLLDRGLVIGLKEKTFLQIHKKYLSIKDLLRQLCYYILRFYTKWLLRVYPF